jgi:succinyl-CoA synthetase alpha subunit
MTPNLKMTPETPVIIQGIEVHAAHLWVDSMRRYGTRIVGWVSGSSEETEADGLPVFRSHAEALSATGAEVCVSVAPPRGAADAILEAADSGIRLIVSLTAGMPLHDAVRVRRRIADLHITYVGPGSSGIAIPGIQVKLGSMPDDVLAPGAIALVTASDSLAAEAGYHMARSGLGQSLYIDVGSHTIKGTPMAALPALLQADEATQAVALLGTTRGTEEEDFAEAIRSSGLTKPVFAYIAGHALPAGALGGFWPSPDAKGTVTTAARKQAALEAAGVKVYGSLGDLIKALQAAA